MKDKKDQAETACDHKGFYKSAGLLPMQTVKGLTVFTFLLCENCGNVTAKTMEFGGIRVPGSSGIAIPR